MCSSMEVAVLEMLFMADGACLPDIDGILRVYPNLSLGCLGVGMFIVLRF